MSNKTEQAVRKRFTNIMANRDDGDDFETLKYDKRQPKTTPWRIVNALHIPLTLISPDPNQPRKRFDQKALQELANSIKEHGILQPITVTRHDTGQYIIVTGERRYRAAQIAGLTELPGIVQDADEHSSKTTAKQLIENIQREDLSPVEKADGLLQLKESLGDDATWDQVEKLTCLSDRRRKQILAVKNLPEVIQQAMVTLGTKRSKGKFTERHARALLRLPTERQQVQLFEQIITERMSGDEAMRMAQNLLGKKKQNRTPNSLGRLVITFNSQEELIAKLREKLAELEQA